jgi:alkylation response protein AidB-like acyl-CoA dehydrogenase
MGWNMQPTSMVIMEDCRVPKGNLIGKKGDGFKIAMKGLDGGRINIASCSIGGAALGIDQAMSHIKTRKQFGKVLSDFQHIQFKIAELTTKLTASRLMTRSAARLIDENSDDKTVYSAMCKYFTTEICFELASEALQLHGGYGYLKDYHIERIFRDLRVNMILEGTNEIMRLIISRNIMKDN